MSLGHLHQHVLAGLGMFHKENIAFCADVACGGRLANDTGEKAEQHTLHARIAECALE